MIDIINESYSIVALAIIPIAVMAALIIYYKGNPPVFKSALPSALFSTLLYLLGSTIVEGLSPFIGIAFYQVFTIYFIVSVSGVAAYLLASKFIKTN